MRMKKIYSFILLAIVVLVACTDSNDIWTPDPDNDRHASAYAVSEETALAYLDSALEMLYGDQADTRATSAKPRVASIRSLRLPNAATRSGVASDAETPLYIVAFEDGAGSAILGADTRVEKIYAILDETVLTPEDFTTHIGTGSSDDAQDIVNFVTQAIVADASYRIASDKGSSNGPADAVSGGIGVGGDDGGFIRAPTYRHVEINVFRQKPLTKTKWNQWEPYNNDCPMVNSTRCPAGCLAIAVAQLLSYHQTGNTVTVAGSSYSWNLLNEFNYEILYRSAEAKAEIARFIRAIGDRLNMEYGPKKSLAYTSSVPGILNESGLQNAKVVSYDMKTGRNMVCSEKKPFYISGDAPDCDEGGHAWIIDGWNEYTAQCWETTYGPNGKINPERLIEETYYCLLHCNYGWGGKCDGYYFDGLFDTTKALDSSRIDSNVGDYSSYNKSDDYKFTINLEMVTY